MTDERSIVILEEGPAYTVLRFSSDMTRLHIRMVLDLLKNKMQARPEGFQFMKAYRKRQWDGYICLVDKRRFPSGLYDIAVETLAAAQNDLDFDLIERRIDRPSNFPYHFLRRKEWLYGITLRDYQITATTKLIQAGRGVAHMATNSGKTIVIAAVLKMLNGTALVITHKKELLYQTAEVIEKTTGYIVGLIGDGHKDMSKDVTVAMVQTLHKMMKTAEFDTFVKGIDTLIVDEVHHVSSKTMYELVMGIPAPWRFGMSGTPLRYTALSDLQLVATTGPVVIEVDNELLVERGFSAEPRVMVHHVVNGDSGDLPYQEVYDRYVVNNKQRNTLIASRAETAYEKGMVVLILVDRLDHQKLLSIEMQLRQLPVVVMNGSHDTEYRRAKLEEMRDGKSAIYISTPILDEGVDVPAIDFLVMAGGGKSHIRTLQRVGRGMRKKSDGENVLYVMDFYDHAKYLKRHSEKRYKIYQNEGFRIKDYDAPAD